MADERKVLTEFFEIGEPEADVHKLQERNRKQYEEGDALFLTGKLGEANSVNGNNRMYPKDILKREVENYKKLINENRALGETDHPDSSVVSLEDASHMITRVWWEGDEIHGNVKVLDTDAGENVKALLEGGVQLGISSRGLGSVREEGDKLVVEDDFQLIAFDFVSDPSTTGAFMLQESEDPHQRSEHLTHQDKVNRILNDIVT